MERHLSKGQQAMAAAMIFPEDGKGGRGNKDEAKNLHEKGRFSRERLRLARQILRYSLPLAQEVMTGNILAVDACGRSGNGSSRALIARRN
jgi:hypothetical protein